MGLPSEPVRVKLITGLISGSRSGLIKAQELLTASFGCADLVSRELPFGHTSYYDREHGGGLKKVFISFKGLIANENIEDIKLRTNYIEKELSSGGKRTVNVDPGYLELSKLVLLTTKNYTHRIHLGKGIYAEVTLVFKGRSFHPLEWTYPDYRTKEYIDIINRIRDIYRSQAKGVEEP
ncbi:DUF4416 family protein [Candidatus Omnitrophota bacterium]